MEKHFTTEKLLTLNFQGVTDYSIRTFANFLAHQEDNGKAEQLLYRIGPAKQAYKAFSFQGMSYVVVFHHDPEKQDYIQLAKSDLYAMKEVADLYYAQFKN